MDQGNGPLNPLLPALVAAAPSLPLQIHPTGLRLPFGTSELGIELIMPDVGKIRVRKLIGRSRRVATGKYPSWKLNRLLHWESSQEAKVLRLLDACPGIKRFAEQPFLIRYLQGDTWRQHVPDVAFCTYHDDLAVLEIKSTVDKGRDEALERADVLRPKFAALGVFYGVVLQERLDAGLALANARLLLRRGATQAIQSDHEQVIQMVADQGEIDAEDLTGRRLSANYALCVASSMALRGHLSINWSTARHSPLVFSSLRENNNEESLSWLLQAFGVSRPS